jgi:predicted metal-dependent peptidase
MQIKNIHEKLMESIQQMLIDTKVNLPYYGNFNLFITFHERKDIDTCGVNMTAKGMQFYYSSEFLDRMSQKEVNFITLHEDFHLLWNHPKRTITGQYDHKLSNIAQDMIINHIIWEDIPNNYVEIPKDPNGRNMALFLPKEYQGKLIFEELYEWLRDEKEKHDKKKQQNQCKSCNGSGQKQDQGQKGQQPGDNQGQGQQPSDSQGQGQQPSDNQGQGQQPGDGKGGQGQGEKQPQDGHNHGGSGEPCSDCQGSGQQGGSGQPQYGPYGKDPKSEKGTIDTWTMDQIFDNLDNNNGQYMDVHMTDEIPEEMRESMVKDAMDRIQARGLQAGNVEQTLNKLRKQRKDYLKHIKRSVSNMIFGTKKQKTIAKPNRRQVTGLKGNRKIKTKINCILDTSGSMGGQGTFERVLSYIYRNDIEVNLIESDTEIKWVKNIKSKRKLESIPIKGLGGTIMQTGFDYVVDNFNEFNTVLLTDGYTDSLDLSKVKGNVLIISVGTECPISKSNGKLKQIVLEPNE